MQYAIAFPVTPGPPLVCSELTCWRLQKRHLSCQLITTRKVRWQCSILNTRIKNNVKDILYLGLRCLLRATWDGFKEKCIVFDYLAPLSPASGSTKASPVCLRSLTGFSWQTLQGPCLSEKFITFLSLSDFKDLLTPFHVSCIQPVLLPALLWVINVMSRFPYYGSSSILFSLIREVESFPLMWRREKIIRRGWGFKTNKHILLYHDTYLEYGSGHLQCSKGRKNETWRNEVCNMEDWAEKERHFSWSPAGIWALNSHLDLFDTLSLSYLEFLWKAFWEVSADLSMQSFCQQKFTNVGNSHW